MEMKILGKGLSTLNDLVEGQKERFTLVENRQVELRDIIAGIISDLHTQLTNELVNAVRQTDSTLKLKFRDKETRFEHIAGMIQTQTETQKKFIIHLERLDNQRKTLFQEGVQMVDRIIVDNFGFMKKYVNGRLTN
jgi:hypothetical protein